jgi:hypothetical protein
MEGKGKVVPMLFSLTEHHAMQAYWGVTSALVGAEWSASHPCSFIPKEEAPGTRCIGGWVGPRTVLDAVVKRKIPNP